ncbi:copper resistance CopC family protein [Desertibacillus haloalkaliphilus]|uniref:copper resistance CopC family protein n=1 Tax=Desertibacillus haloalkaliphilus TaxID=1328930 RepID=UPI001C26D687|nr:copper resistance protein CopC [Desertibacillus haloalkaliphilus]MBU8906675.1 copper resistance protein CopC [Desertibacillus haloalkaliphilus]
MTQKALLIMTALMVLFAIPNTIFAHSHLESSNPANGEVVEEELGTILLTFDAGIEAASTVEIIDEDGGEVAIEGVEIDSPHMEVILPGALENGHYQVNWTALGEDTHITEGEFSFTVERPEVQEQEEEELVDPPATDEEVDQADLVEEVEESSDEEGTTTGSNLMVIFIVVVLVAIVIAVFISKRK